MEEQIKKVIVPIEELPALADGEQYFVRYRIVSEDQNRTSSWSPTIPFSVIRGIDILDGGEVI